MYLNNAVNTVKKLRNEAKGGTSADMLSPEPKVKTEVGYMSPKKSLSPQKPGTPSPKKSLFMSHEAVLGGKKSMQSNFTFKRSGKHTPVPDKFTGEYHFLKNILLCLTNDRSSISKNITRLYCQFLLCMVICL